VTSTPVAAVKQDSGCCLQEGKCCHMLVVWHWLCLLVECKLMVVWGSVCCVCMRAVMHCL